MRNTLTPAEEERLIMLAEEASEVIKAVTKLIRFGWSGNTGQYNNRVLLFEEVADFQAVARECFRQQDIAEPDKQVLDFKWKHKLAHSFHQRESAQ